MIHARIQGESFGLAIAEFAVNSKPIITSVSTDHNNHLKILKDKVIIYDSKDSLIKIFDNIREIKSSKDQIHLHLELWIDGEYLGNDMKPIQIRKFLQYFFTE